MRDTFYTSVDFRSPASLSKVATMKSGFKNFFLPPECSNYVNQKRE